jgi:hypothetical protein
MIDNAVMLEQTIHEWRKEVHHKTKTKTNIVCRERHHRMPPTGTFLISAKFNGI